MISDTTERLLITYRNSFLQKNVFFPHVRNFTVFYGPYRGPFWPYFDGNFTFLYIVNNCSILKLMLCNQNLSKFDILTLLSSDCRA